MQTDLAGWLILTNGVEFLANLATAGGIIALVIQVKKERRDRSSERQEEAQDRRMRRIEAAQGIWRILATEDIYKARRILEYSEEPADFAAASAEGDKWIIAAETCYAAYMRAAKLVMEYEWFNINEFAVQWGFSTLRTWQRIQRWIRWYAESQNYDGFGETYGRLVAKLKDMNTEKLRFDTSMELWLPPSVKSASSAPTLAARAPSG